MKTKKLYIDSLIRHLRLLFVVLITSAAITSCDHETDPPDGPNLIDSFGPFTVVQNLTVNRENVDFSAGETVVFTAQFNKNVDWVLTITGSESGAVKTIQGFNRNVEASNATWNGGTTLLPFFKNESCNIELTVPEEPDYIDTATVEIVGTKTYPGILVADFEQNPGASIELGNYEFELTPESGRNNDAQAGQGEYFFRLEGTDNESGGPTDNFFVGLANIFPSINNVTYFEVPTTVPDNLYLNCMIRGNGSAYTRAIVALAFDSNNNEQFDDGIDAVVEFTVDPTYSGWRLQSTSLADLEVTSEQIEKIVAVRLILISRNDIQTSPREEVGFLSDFITFTQGAPLAL